MYAWMYTPTQGEVYAYLYTLPTHTTVQVLPVFHKTQMRAHGHSSQTERNPWCHEFAMCHGFAAFRHAKVMGSLVTPTRMHTTQWTHTHTEQVYSKRAIDMITCDFALRRFSVGSTVALAGSSAGSVNVILGRLMGASFCQTHNSSKAKGLDIHITPLTGKPWPAAVYNLKWRTDRQWH